MKIYDISQEVFSCTVFPGDPAPKKEILTSLETGEVYNLSAFSMCVHNGTHIDAPKHFFDDGKTVDQIPLKKLIGPAYVTEQEGIMNEETARNIIIQAYAHNKQAAARILIKGNAVVSEKAAEEFARAGIDLIGSESQSVGPEEAPMAVHKILLSAEVILLEGIRLSEVPEGVYLLNAAPICLGGTEGAPCRAVLLEIL